MHILTSQLVNHAVSYWHYVRAVSGSPQTLLHNNILRDGVGLSADYKVIQIYCGFRRPA